MKYITNILFKSIKSFTEYFFKKILDIIKFIKNENITIYIKVISLFFSKI